MEVENRNNNVEYVRVVDLKRLQFIENSISHLDPKNSLLLDVGCGNGNISRYLGSLNFKTIGIDISEKAIEKAKSLNKFSNVEFHVKSAEKLDEENFKFDAIICSEVLEHLDKPLDLLFVLHSILKKDGILIVTVPNGFGPREVLMTKPMQWMRKNNSTLWSVVNKTKKILGYSGQTIQSDADNLDHVHFFSHNRLKLMAQNAQFNIVKFEKADFIEDVFPFSLFTKRVTSLQKLDCKIADMLPVNFTGGFHTAWTKK